MLLPVAVAPILLLLQVAVLLVGPRLVVTVLLIAPRLEERGFDGGGLAAGREPTSGTGRPMQHFDPRAADSPRPPPGGGVGGGGVGR